MEINTGHIDTAKPAHKQPNAQEVDLREQLNASETTVKEPAQSPGVKVSLSEQGIGLSKNDSIKISSPPDESEFISKEEALSKYNIRLNGGASITRQEAEQAVSDRLEFLEYAEISDSTADEIANLKGLLDHFDRSLQSSSTDYDFTMRQDGSLKVISNSLTKREIKGIEEKLNANTEILAAAKSIQDATLRAFGDDQLNINMPSGIDLRGLTINETTLAETINFKELVERGDSKEFFTANLSSRFSASFSEIPKMIASKLMS